MKCLYDGLSFTWVHELLSFSICILSILHLFIFFFDHVACLYV